MRWLIRRVLKRANGDVFEDDIHFGDTLGIGRGTDAWIPGTWELMDEAGAIVAGEVIAALEKGLEPVTPKLASASEEMRWALEPAPGKEFFEAIIANKRCSVEMYSSLKPEASLKASCNTRWVSFERWVPPKP